MRESVFEAIAFRLWYISYWPYNMAILQVTYILFTELIGEIVAKGALLNKVAAEIVMTCSDIDRYLPSMLKSAVK